MWVKSRCLHSWKTKTVDISVVCVNVRSLNATALWRWQSVSEGRLLPGPQTSWQINTATVLRNLCTFSGSRLLLCTCSELTVSTASGQGHFGERVTVKVGAQVRALKTQSLFYSHSDSYNKRRTLRGWRSWRPLPGQPINQCRQDRFIDWRAT